MPKFKITAKFVTYCTIEIDAENENDAYLKAKELDGGDFEPWEHGDWEISSVTEIVPALTEEQAAFMATYADAVADATPEEVRQFLEMDGDAFIEKHGVHTYTTIMDARLVWLQALNFTDRKAAQ